MTSPGAYAIAAAFCLSFAAVAFTNLDGVANVWPIAVAVLLVSGGVMAILAVPGDPLGPGWSVALATLGPGSSLLILTELSPADWTMNQVWQLRATTAILTYLSVRGRVGLALVGSLATWVVCASWSAETGQGISTGIDMYAINFGPVLMSVVFAFTIRPMARMVYSLRGREAVRAAEEARSHTAIEERNRLLGDVVHAVGGLLQSAAAGEIFDAEKRLECRIAEARLRDLLRAPALGESIDVAVAVAQARRRGCTVVLLDDRDPRNKASDDLGPLVSTIETAARDLPDGGSMTVRINPEGRSLFATVVSTFADTDTVRYTV